MLPEGEWVPVGTHTMLECWCGHDEPFVENGKTLDQARERIHQWITLGCDEVCAMTGRVHGHVHVHCRRCAAKSEPGDCCMAMPP
jgi:hypothetical protein